MQANITRRALLLGVVLAGWLGGCVSGPTAPPPPPIVFVHGNGDTAGLWLTTIWRFESNGWPRERLHAIDLPYPLARDADDKPQPGRTSTTEHMQFLSAEVDKVLKATGAAKVVLYGNSRGGNAIRNYIANGGGAAKVSHAILGGTPNHGVWAHQNFLPNSEFNGTGAFLVALNAPKGAKGEEFTPGVKWHGGLQIVEPAPRANDEEVTPGVKWLTIRSDNNDKFAQPDGVWIGAKGTPTNVGFDGPELKGAENVVIAGIDHRETSFSAKAFEQAYRFITGRAPTTTAPVPEAKVALNGKVSGLGLDNTQGSFVNNLPLVGAQLEVYATDAATGERVGAAAHRKTVAADGLWGPFNADAKSCFEFVVTMTGYATTHVYRCGFTRSSNVVNLRAERLADADKDAYSVVTLVRPRGYFGVPRDAINFDGISPPPGVPSGVAGVAQSKIKVMSNPARSIAGEFNGERIVGRTWPAAESHVVFLELHH